jgi:hypothetical protein
VSSQTHEKLDKKPLKECELTDLKKTGYDRDEKPMKNWIRNH